MKKNLIEIISNLRNTGESKEDKQKNKQQITKWLFYITLASIGTFIAYKVIQFYTLGISYNGFWDAIGKGVISYCKNVVTILFLPLVLTVFNFYISKYVSNNKRDISLKIDLEDKDQYETLLKEIINEKSENKDFKVIAVIDDLDRLSLKKIVEALDAIKALVGFEKCIFIVPFDDSILKKALEKNKINGLQVDHETIETELILDKLFQYKIYLPPILKFDIKKYAINLVYERIPDFCSDYLPEKHMNDIIRNTLIHKGVKTPRQVKKIVNIFITNYIVAHDRDLINDIDEEKMPSKSSVRQIAIISVLQADFNEFYDILFDNFQYIEMLFDYQKNANNLDDIDEGLKQYFVQKQDSENNWTGKPTIKREHSELINFLRWTDKYRVEYIAPYMFLAESEISRKTGDKSYRDIIDAIESKNFVFVYDELRENEKIADVISERLEDKYEDIEELISAIESGIYIFDLVNEDKKVDLATIITDKVEEAKSNLQSINYSDLETQNIIEVYKKSDREDFSKTLIDSYISKLMKIEDYDEDYLCKALDVLITEENNFDQDTVKEIIEYGYKLIESNDINEIKLLQIAEKYYDDSDKFMKYFNTKLLSRLVEELSKEKYDERIIPYFKSVIKIIIVKLGIEEVIGYILTLFGVRSLLEVLNELITTEIGNSISEKYATEIMTEIVSSAPEQPELDTSMMILNKIKYKINPDIAPKVDTCFQKVIDDNILLDLLNYCAEKNYFGQISNTIIKLTNSVIADTSMHGVFAKVENAYIDSQKTYLQQRLIKYSQYAHFAKYQDQVLRVYSILLKNDNNTTLINNCVNSLIDQFNSYYNQEPYYNFTSTIIGKTHALLTKQTLTKFIGILNTIYNNYYNKCTKTIELIQDSLQKSDWDLIMPKIINLSNVTEDNFDMVSGIVEKQSKYFNKENNNLSNLVNFLVNTIDIAENPNINIKKLGKHFKHILMEKELITKCTSNEKIDNNLATSTLAKFFDNRDEKKYIFDIFMDSLTNQNESKFIISTIRKTKNFKLSTIINETCKRVNETKDLNTIYNLLDAVVHIKNEINPDDILEIISIGLEYHDNIDEIKKLKNRIMLFGNNYFTKSRLASFLYGCYHNTNIDEVKNLILILTNDMKLRRQFFPLQNDEEKTYYKSFFKLY